MGPVALSHSPAPDGLVILLSPAEISAGQKSAQLTIQDEHSGPLLPGLSYTPVISGTQADLFAAASAQLLVGGLRVYLPAVLR